MATNWRTKLIHSNSDVPQGFRSLVTPTYRGSTTLFKNAASVRDDWRQEVAPYTYGSHGTPTTLELGARIAELEKGVWTFITPGGQSAIALIYLAFVGAGDHILVPDSAYGPSRDLAQHLMRRFRIEVDFYDPLIGLAIERLIKPHTQLIWCESPGSVTMEVQDVPAIADAAHGHSVTVALDNTYAAGIYLDAFACGVDVTMQSLTKYVGGHSDLVLGSVTVRDRKHYEAVGAVHQHLGLVASPDECALALRGMKTLGVRLREIEQSALSIARWLRTRPEIDRVLHPALPSCLGHDTWRRDFTGSAGVFSVVFEARIAKEKIVAFVDALQLFKIGYSWGGVTSLAMPHFSLIRSGDGYHDRLVRLSIGLEATDDLIADLDQAFARIG